MPSDAWFGVRTVFWIDEHRVYEERITIWTAATIDEAIERAEEEAEEYGRLVGGTFLGLLQAFSLDGSPADGMEVFSLMRESDLGPSEYLDTFFDTGRERQQPSDGE